MKKIILREVGLDFVPTETEKNLNICIESADGDATHLQCLARKPAGTKHRMMTKGDYK